jgi:hypothetical protein
MDPVWSFQWDLLASVGTVALAIATIWLVLETRRLVFETRRMREGSDKAMETMAKHAEKSAHAAETSAAATKALVEVGQRPWISIRSIYLEHEVSSYHRALSLSTTFVNSGATPATNMLAYHYYLVTSATSDEFPDTPEYPSTPASTPIPISIPARDKRRVFVQIPMSDADVIRVVNREGDLYVYGVAIYRDGFGNEHRTKWCSRYNGGIGDQTRFSLAGKHESIE